MVVFLIIIFWIIFTIILAFHAKNKGRSFKIFFIIGLLLSPLIGSVILLAIGEDKEAIKRLNLINAKIKYCPFCANVIKWEAVICQYCKKDLHTEYLEDENNFEEDDDEEEEEVDENLKNSFDAIFAAAGNTNEHEEYESDYDDEEEKNNDDERYSRHEKNRDIENGRDNYSEREEKTVSNNNKKVVGVKYYYCKHCGVKNSSVFGLINSSGCLKSPTKKHELYESSEKNQYMCKYCGVKNSSITGLVISSNCSKSPTKKHEPAL
ncbi:MAG: hypothetical protein FWG29_05490 [Treponema sp.]|nr:hypothetical protein [Treponema sp.]